MREEHPPASERGFKAPKRAWNGKCWPSATLRMASEWWTPGVPVAVEKRTLRKADNLTHVSFLGSNVEFVPLSQRGQCVWLRYKSTNFL